MHVIPAKAGISAGEGHVPMGSAPKAHAQRLRFSPAEIPASAGMTFSL
jgi:hypothetical protein